MRSGTFIPLAAALLAAAPAAAQTAQPIQTVPLAPGGTALTLRAYALGVVPLDGSFARFRGRIDYPPDRPDRCAVELVADSQSLSFSDQSVRDEVLSPAFLDAAAFPTLAFRGTCAARTVAGQLLMHGQTHPLSLELTADGARLLATGTIDRTEWGVTGRSMSVGSSVRIQVTVALPESAQGALRPLLSGAAR